MLSNRTLKRFLTLPNKTAIAFAVVCTAILADRSAIADNPFIILQSTTSTQNSGLYDYLLPHFTTKSGIDVRVVAVGTGQALRNAERCDGDILITHSKVDEVKDEIIDRFGELPEVSNNLFITAKIRSVLSEKNILRCKIRESQIELFPVDLTEEVNLRIKKLDKRFIFRNKRLVLNFKDVLTPDSVYGILNSNL